MKTGMCSQYYERWGKMRYRKLKEHGYDYVDYDLSDTDKPVYSCDGKELEAALRDEKKLMDEAGIEVSQVHGPWRWPPRDHTPEERQERMEKMKKSIRMTALLGCKNWVVHPVMPYGTADRGTEHVRETWDINIAFMGELLKTAKECDVTICLENMPMPEFSIGSPSEILKFVRAINNERFKACLDTGHVAVYEGLTPDGAMRELGDTVRVLHVHDNNGRSDLHYMPYFGVIDWKAFAKALKECGFGGVFSIETAPPQKLPDSLYEEMCLTLSKIAKEIIAG